MKQSTKFQPERDPSTQREVESNTTGIQWFSCILIDCILYQYGMVWIKIKKQHLCRVENNYILKVAFKKVWDHIQPRNPLSTEFNLFSALKERELLHRMEGFYLRPEAGCFIRSFFIPRSVLWFQYLQYLHYFIIINCFYLSILWIYWQEDNRLFFKVSSGACPQTPLP